MHDSSTLIFSNAHVIHSPYFNYTCIFLSISPLFYLNSWFFFNKHICLILFNINFLPTFQKKSCLFSKNSHVLSHPTHLFTNTYFLHTYLIHSHTFLTLTFPFPISFTAQKRFPLLLQHSLFLFHLFHSQNPTSFQLFFHFFSYTHTESLPPYLFFLFSFSFYFKEHHQNGKNQRLIIKEPSSGSRITTN